ncbi:MAG: DNA/RNA nuclease SfsA [Candidatus Rokuibacteriota bacterium]
MQRWKWGRCWQEVKSVALRGRKYLRELVRPVRAGQRAALVFVVQRGDCVASRPADEVDPEYGRSCSEPTTSAPTTWGSGR